MFVYANQRLKREPVLAFGWPSPKHRRFCRYVTQGLEALLRGSGSSAKTRTGAAILVACAQGRKELAGEPLPAVPVPMTGWILTQSYKQQVDASQAAILLYLGDWPHKISYVAGESKGYIENIWIATTLCTHETDERCKTCSKIVFHCAESQSAIGGRIDLAWADEPPDGDAWREVRWRGRGDRPFYRMITATPIEKRWWHWMPADFKDCEDKPSAGRVEVRVTMDDNRFLAEAAKRDKREAARNDPRERARLYGDYVDLRGRCPFPPEKLQVWLDRCRPPKLHRLEIVGEMRTVDGDAPVRLLCDIEVWYPFEEEETYVGVLDAATMVRLDHRTGLIATEWIDDSSSLRGVPDFCGFHLYARRRRRLCARFRGYSGAYGLGSIAARVAMELYGGNVLLDTDLTGGHGDPTVRAITDAGFYTMNSYLPPASNPRAGSPKLGFTMNAANRAEMIASIQMALINDTLLCESEIAVRSLMEVTYTITDSGTERPEASWGAKDEDMICMGRAAQLMETLPMPARVYVSPIERMRRLRASQSTALALLEPGAEDDDNDGLFWG